MADINSDIKDMKAKGMGDSKIVDELKNKGHTSQDIYSSLEKTAQQPATDLEPPSPGGMESSMSSSQPMDAAPMEPQGIQAPSLDQVPNQIPQRGNIEQIEEISEAIVEEKIQEFSSLIGDINIWKERSNAEIGAIKQEILRLRNQLENLQTTMIGKVETYNKSVSSMSTEMKALSKVMEKIMQPLATNVKELSKISEKFKKIK